MVLSTVALTFVLCLFGTIGNCSCTNQLSSLIDSFAPCVLHIVNFNEDYFFYTSLLPVILTVVKKNRITRSRARTYRRKYVFCVANILLFPEHHLKITGTKIAPKEAPETLEWIDEIITKTSPLYRDDDRRSSVWCLEQHFLLIFSIKNPNFWAPAMRHGKINQVARFFIFQIIRVHTTWESTSKRGIFIINQISHVCALCSKTRTLAIKFPSSFLVSGNMTQFITKSLLKLFENEITGGGRNIFVTIGNLNYENHLQGSFLRRDFEYPSYLTNQKQYSLHNISLFLVDQPELKINEIIEILLFEGMDYTNASKFNHIMDNYEVTEFPMIHPHQRPSIRFQDTRRDRINFNKAFVMINDYSFNFITCDGSEVSLQKESLQFSRVLAPYSQLVWIVWGLQFIGFVFFLGLLLNKLHSRKCTTCRRKHESLLHSFAFSMQYTISSSLENGTELQLTSLPTKYKVPVYLTLCGWLLALILFNNVYKGVLTSDEVIQAPVTSK